LSQVLRQLPAVEDVHLLVGLHTSDDAAVYKISDELAFIQTVDFFTPVVDDPYIFGQIAAANALSDVYAMGGRPLLALNIVCFPNCLSRDVLVEILRGGADKVKEAGALIVGGHTVQDDEPKYGLSVTGLIHPNELITNAGAKPGDLLILTKPLGTGIINTAMKAGLASPESCSASVEYMSALNDKASLVMKKAGASACTDITGFGLLGHAAEMAVASGVSLTFRLSDIPLLPEVLELASMGLIPAGAYQNRDFLGEQVSFDPGAGPAQKAVLFDPQTSGGLLIAVEEKKAGLLLDNLNEAGISEARMVGLVTTGGNTPISVVI
jgi:selenide,water dikinase